MGNPGNETADALAKRGTKLGEDKKLEGISAPVINQKNNIKRYYYNKWNSEWKSCPEARQTKQWFPNTDRHKSKKVIQIDKAQLGKLVQFLTGHNNLMRHRYIKDQTIDPTCRLCKEKKTEESSFHVIAICPKLWRTRWQIFHQQLLTDPPNWTPCQVTRFLRESPIGDLMDQHG